MDIKAKKIIAALRQAKRPDLANAVADVTDEWPRDWDKILKMSQGMLGISKKNLNRDKKQVWLGVASAILELTKMVYDLDPTISQNLEKVGNEILMKGRK